MQKAKLGKDLHVAMVNFQYLEFMLQGAITQFELIIGNKVSGLMQYPVNEKSISTMGLSKLAEKYAQYTGDKKFRVRVDEIVRSRNKLAHALFMRAEYFDDQFDKNIPNDMEEVLKHSTMADSMADEVIMHMQNIYNPSVEEFEKLLEEELR